MTMRLGASGRLRFDTNARDDKIVRLNTMKLTIGRLAIIFVGFSLVSVFVAVGYQILHDLPWWMTAWLIAFFVALIVLIVSDD
jgi:hypothetical protein